MAVINLLEEKSLNNYLQDLVYDGGAPKIIRVTSVDQARENIDAIANNIVFQYFKLRIRTNVSLANQACFVQVDKKRSDLPEWTQTTFARGENIYEFDASKVPNEFRNELVKVRDYLCAVAVEHIESICQSGNIEMLKTYAYLKNSEEYADFNKVFKMVKHQVLVDAQHRLQLKIWDRFVDGTAKASELNLVVADNPEYRGKKIVDYDSGTNTFVTENSFRNQAALVLRRDAELRARYNTVYLTDGDMSKYSKEIQNINKKFLDDADKVKSNTEFNQLLRHRHVAIERAIMKELGGQDAILKHAYKTKDKYLGVIADMLKDERDGAKYASIIKNWDKKSYDKQRAFFNEFVKRAYPSINNLPEVNFGAAGNSSHADVINISNKTKNIRVDLLGNRRTLHQHKNFDDAALAFFHELEHHLISHNPEFTVFKGKENLIADTLIQIPTQNNNGDKYGGFLSWDSGDTQKTLSVDSKSEFDKLVQDLLSVNSGQEFDYRFLNPNENAAHRVGEVAGSKFLENLKNKLLSEYKESDKVPDGVRIFLASTKKHTMKNAAEKLNRKNKPVLFGKESRLN